MKHKFPCVGTELEKYPGVTNIENLIFGTLHRTRYPIMIVPEQTNEKVVFT